ncbi:PEGA domain-containing protein [Haliangium ochraceum]|uniref:PEGA domain protein n=1 Tax=Haliangium ochraceum (strain DSM 14365 / JCM 11303 / SMP-2) TaxID=502025 RepID=D0LS05_HALO1|nr:PEGA domain-containing protein [Haliangium ochraceum]ACY13702.1 PEGA domain protein [Haliangium ochraceum DSM 14365]
MNSRSAYLLVITWFAYASLACEPRDASFQLDPLRAEIEETDATEPGTATAPVTDTSYEDVLTQKHAIGTLVRFDAKFLPSTLIMLSQNGSDRYFALVADARAIDFDELRAAAAGLREIQEKHLSQTARLVAKPQQLTKIVDQYLALTNRLEHALPSAHDLVAVELAEAEHLRDIDWKYVKDKPPEPQMLPWGRKFSLGFDAPQATQTFAVSVAIDRLEMLLSKQPPWFDVALPTVNPSIVNRYSASDVRLYNKFVSLHNQEVKRRRTYGLQRLSEKAIILLTYIDDLVKSESYTIEARVTTAHEQANQIYEKSLKRTPRVYVQESSSRDSIVKRQYARTHLQITSYPTGATVSIAGKKVGKTPHLIRDLAADATLELTLDKRGYESFTETVTAKVRILGTYRFEGALKPAARRRR